MILDLSDVIFQTFDVLIGLKAVKFRYPLDLDLCQPNDIVLHNFPSEQRFVWLQSFIDRRKHRFPCFALFNIAVDSLFDEDLLER